jgi:hypothetical protein
MIHYQLRPDNTVWIGLACGALGYMGDVIGYKFIQAFNQSGLNSLLNEGLGRSILKFEWGKAK